MASDQELLLREALGRLATPYRCTAKLFPDRPDTECECLFVPCGSDRCVERQLAAIRQERTPPLSPPEAYRCSGDTGSGRACGVCHLAGTHRCDG